MVSPAGLRASRAAASLFGPWRGYGQGVTGKEAPRAGSTRLQDLALRVLGVVLLAGIGLLPIIVGMLHGTCRIYIYEGKYR